VSKVSLCYILPAPYTTCDRRVEDSHFRSDRFGINIDDIVD